MIAINPTPLAAQIVDFLNDAVNHDREFIEGMINDRKPCNDAMRDHPTIQVGLDGNGQAICGFLGLINGFVLAQGDTPIGAAFDDSGKLINFMTIAPIAGR